jgi:cytochrome c oxidase subunit 2
VGRRAEDAARIGGGRSEQGVGAQRARHARRDHLRRELRCLSSGKRQGCARRVPGARRSKIVNGPKDAQIAIVLHGKPGTAMPPWTQLSDIDIASVITYTRNSWGNKTGEAVQPSDIKAARK